MIKTYLEFINEVYDSTATARAEEELTKLKKDINEYQVKKTIVHNIFMTYKDDADLVAKLKAQKLVANFEVDPKNQAKVRETTLKQAKRMKFLNPLLDQVSRIAEKRREINKLEKDISKQEETISDRKASISSDPQLGVSFQEDIDKSNEKIGRIKDDIDRLNTEIKELETLSAAEIQQARKKLSLKTKQMSMDMMSRRQTDIVDKQ
jgi:hypothetical protein